MHYYIYPKNWDGEDISENIAYFDEDCTYSFIDDNIAETSLEYLEKEIKNREDSLILISSKYRYFEIAEKLESFGITNYVDGLKFSANKIACSFNSRKLAKGSVGFLMANLPHSDHSKKIISEFLKRDIHVVFLITNHALLAHYRTNFPNSMTLLTRSDLLECLDFFDVGYATTDCVKFHTSVCSVLAPQGFLDPVQNYFYLSKQQSDASIGSRATVDYIVAHSRGMAEISRQLLRPIPHPHKIVQGGYPSLGAYIQAYEAFASTRSVKTALPIKTVIVGFTVDGSGVLSQGKDDEEVDICGLSPRLIRELLAELLKEYRVIFRPHPESAKSLWMKEIADFFRYHPRFIYDTSSRLSPEFMSEAFTLITNQSSIGHTFPLATCKKAIVYIPNKSFIQNLGEVAKGAVNPTLQYLAHSIDEVLIAVKKIELAGAANQQEIEHYRATEVFNLGHSSEFIVDFIQGLLDRRARTDRYTSAKG